MAHTIILKVGTLRTWNSRFTLSPRSNDRNAYNFFLTRSGTTGLAYSPEHIYTYLYIYTETTVNGHCFFVEKYTPHPNSSLCNESMKQR